MIRLARPVCTPGLHARFAAEAQVVVVKEEIERLKEQARN
jgi:hypothetical protein